MSRMKGRQRGPRLNKQNVLWSHCAARKATCLIAECPLGVTPRWVWTEVACFYGKMGKRRKESINTWVHLLPNADVCHKLCAHTEYSLSKMLGQETVQIWDVCEILKYLPRLLQHFPNWTWCWKYFWFWSIFISYFWMREVCCTANVQNKGHSGSLSSVYLHLTLCAQKQFTQAAGYVSSALSHLPFKSHNDHK